MMLIFNSIFEAVAFNSMEPSAIYNPHNIKHAAIKFLKCWCSSLTKQTLSYRAFCEGFKASRIDQTKLNIVKCQSPPLISTLGGINYNQGALG